MINISIIIPVYKVEHYIAKCVNSVISQTFTGKIECIFVDDCSPDSSCNIVSEVISRYSGNIQFRIIHHKENGGLSAARNTGIREACGEYIYFLDSDDYIIPECLEILYNVALKYPSAEIIQAGTISESGIFQNIETRTDIPDYIDDIIWIRKRLYNYPDFIVTAWNKLIKRDFILQNNLFFKEGLIHEDVHWLYYVSKVINSIAYCKVNTYHYVQRESSIMGEESFNPKVVSSWISMAKSFIKDIDEVCKEEQIELIYKRCLHPFVSLSRTPKEQRKILRELMSDLSLSTNLYHRKLIIKVTRCFPVLFNERRIVYKFLDNCF